VPNPPRPTPTPTRSDKASTSTEELDELTDAFLRTARALAALAVRSVNASPVEVTLMQHRVLVLLASLGEQTVGALAEQLAVNASNASRVCDRLQRQGLLSRRRSAADARSVKIAVTAEGMAVLHAVAEHRRTEVRRILGTVTPAVARGTVEALRIFNDAAHEVADADWVVPERTGAAEVDSTASSKGT
jgi:DNA-binding MarR family transcriptional regulator